jgi:hypothetical protein
MSAGIQDTKKAWIKPQLVILGRGAEEEKVLLACKRFLTAPSPGPTHSSIIGCYINAACHNNVSS